MRKLFRVIKKENAWAPQPATDLLDIPNRLLESFFTIEELPLPREHPLELTSLSLHSSENGHLLYMSQSNHGHIHDRLLQKSQIFRLVTSPDQEVMLNQWEMMSSPARPVSILRVSLHNPNLVFTGYIHGFRSEDGGASWLKLPTEPGHMPGDGDLHVDIKEYSFHPKDSTKIYVYTDGGIFESNDGGINWRPLNQGLTNLMVYSVAQSALNLNRFAIGLQDQGVWEFKNENWQGIATGDGVALVYGQHKPISGRMGIDQEESLYAGMQVPYSTYNLTDTRRLRQSLPAPTLWKPPLVRIGSEEAPLYLSATKESIVKTSAALLNSTNRRALNWSSTNSQIKNTTILKPSPLNASHILAYAREDSVSVASFWKSEDAGESWSKETTYDPGMVSDIEFDPDVPQRIYITRTDTANTVLFSDDTGKNWNSFTDATFDQLKLPVTDLIIVPASNENEDTLFLIGTDIGVFVRTLNSRWSFAGFRLPRSVITQMLYRKEDRTLLVATFGRGLWRGTLPQTLQP